MNKVPPPFSVLFGLVFANFSLGPWLPNSLTFNAVSLDGNYGMPEGSILKWPRRLYISIPEDQGAVP